MNQALVRTLAALRDDPKRPHHTCPGYDHWMAHKIWEAAVKYCAEMSGPQCADAIREFGANDSVVCKSQMKRIAVQRGESA